MDEVGRDFRGHPAKVYYELIEYCQRVAKISDYLKDNHTKEEYEAYIRENIPEVRQT